ncbi:hypothetical protein [Zongyangia hominis]|uniref:Uncharacterized protein n=1 Tax=Zongyangia hominis TaxID=2763677 RepID=A0A926IBW0_9FIRM|nr:hypothetical protein [Zongyangia hominis]MBC8570480.1 hypothetical protein [Zongyangia hominis]
MWKVWGKKGFWCVVAALFAVNLFLLWYIDRPERTGIPAGANQRLASDLQGLSEEEKTALLEGSYERAAAYALIERIRLAQAAGGEDLEERIDFMKSEHPGLAEKYEAGYDSAAASPRYAVDWQREAEFLAPVVEELRQIHGYPAFLEEIRNKSERLSGISIFGGAADSFSTRNIRKTAADYARLGNRNLSFDNSHGLLAATDSIYGDVLFLLALFALSCVLVFEEKQKGLFSLLRASPKGRRPLMAAKLSAMAVSAGILALLLFGGGLIWCAATMGLGALDRPLQSVGAFMGSALPLTIWQYLLLFFLTKWATGCLAGLCVFFISLHVRHPALAFLALAALFGTGFALYAGISPFSSWNLLKYLNPAAILRTNTIYTTYRNFNLFGWPANQIPVTVFFLCIALISLVAACLLTAVHKRNYSVFQMALPSLGHSPHIRRRSPAGVWGQEAYKLLIKNKAALFLALFGILTVFLLPRQPAYLTPDEWQYRAALQELEGIWTPEKQGKIDDQLALIEDAQEHIEAIDRKESAGEISRAQADQMSAPFDRVLQGRELWDALAQRAETLQGRPGAGFLYDTGYRTLFARTGNAGNLLPLLVTMVLCFSTLFAMEYPGGTIRLIGAAPLGRRRTAASKLTLCFLLTPLLLALSALPELVSVGITYGFPGLSLPAASLPDYAGLPIWLPVWGLLAAHYLCQMIVCIAATALLCALSLKTRKPISSMLLGAMLLGGPVLLTAMGLSSAKYASLLPALELGRYAAQPEIFALFPWFFLFYLAVGGVCTTYVFVRFGQPWTFSAHRRPSHGAKRS